MKKRTTKKRSYSKKKINSLKKCKMNLREKEFLAVGIFAVFVFAFLLAVQTNIPQDNNYVKVTGHDIAGLEKIDTSKAGTFLSNIINPEKADDAVIKWFTFFTFALGLWGLASLILGKKEKGTGILKLLSLPIAFAMVYLIKPDEIFSALIGYSALGMTIIVLLPFLAVMLFSVRLLEGRLTALKTIIQLLVWYFYLGFLLYFLIRAIWLTPGETYSLGVIIVILGGIAVSIFAIIKNEALREWIANLNRQGVAKEIKDLQHALGIEEESKYDKIKREAGF